MRPPLFRQLLCVITAHASAAADTRLNIQIDQEVDTWHPFYSSLLIGHFLGLWGQCTEQKERTAANNEHKGTAAHAAVSE